MLWCAVERGLISPMQSGRMWRDILVISGPIDRTSDIDVSLYLDFTQKLSVPSTGKASINEILEGDVRATYGVLGRLRLTERGITYGREPMVTER